MLGKARASQMKHSTVSSVVEALLKARVFIETDWCKGFGHGGQVCAIDALWRVAPFANGVTYLQKALPEPWLAVMAYNDDPTTTQADILALYDRAIDLALKAEQ
jgi:hypothetical protein